MDLNFSLFFWVQILSYLPLLQEGPAAGFPALGSSHNRLCINPNYFYFYVEFIDTSLHVFVEGKCPSPNITNGRAKITGRNQLGAVAKYSCSKGYSLEGVETRVSLTFIYSLFHI